MKKPRKYVVGFYKLGFRNVKLSIDTGTANGEVDLIPEDNGITTITVGIDSSWSESFSVLLHEVYEGVLVDLQTRYKQKPSYSQESSDFMFIATHNQLSEAAERAGVFLSEALPAFMKAYKKHSPY